MAMGIQEPHTAELGNEVRCLGKGNGAKTAADTVASLEQAYSQLGPFLPQSPRGVRTGSAGADDRNFDIGSRVATRHATGNSQGRR